MLSTGHPQLLPHPVDKFPSSMRNYAYLSTKTVDKSSGLWIITMVFGGVAEFYTIFSILAVDKPVDNRGKICG
jgi:hypothetical protein